MWKSVRITGCVAYITVHVCNLRISINRQELARLSIWKGSPAFQSCAVRQRDLLLTWTVLCFLGAVSYHQLTIHPFCDNCLTNKHRVVQSLQIMCNVTPVHVPILKPMDSFGIHGVKIKWNKKKKSLNHNLIVLCELLMPCQLFAQECSDCREINKISKYLPVVI